MPDYIPEDDETFNTYATEQFGPYAAANAIPLGIPTAQTSALQSALTAWGYAWPGLINAKNGYDAAVEEKDAQRVLLTAAIRQIAGTVQNNPAVTNAQKESLGITVRKTTRTPVPVPSTVPSIQRIDTSTRGILRLFIVDATTPESRAKPFGVQGCEIREQIGGTAPVNPETMAFLAIETRMPYRADFEAEDIGKTVYFALRWVNKTGQPGPWSAVVEAVIPG